MSVVETQGMPTLTVPRRRRWWLWIGLIGVVLIGSVGLFAYWYRVLRPQWELQAAMAEADRLDPGWRLEELEAKREEIPDEENGAIVAQTAARGIPNSWYTKEMDDMMKNMSPPVLLSENQACILAGELFQVDAALVEARKLVNLPRGRHAIVWSPDFFSTLMTHAQDLRKVTRALVCDAVLRAHEGDMPGAIQSIQAAINAARSLGDEPLLISLLIRLACRNMAFSHLERVLAQGESPAPLLASLQQLLEDEEAQPLLLIAVRGERAGWARFVQAVDKGLVPANDIRMLLDSHTQDQSVVRKAINDILPVVPELPGAAVFRYLTEVVEAAKLPVERQEVIDGLKAPKLFDEEEPIFSSAYSKTAKSYRRGQALLRCAILMLAVERFRQEQGHWPDWLYELVPTYIKGVPKDPFDGAPLRYRRLADGFVIYSIGPKRTDRIGTLFRAGIGPLPPDCDLGFQLWDPDKRRQPAKEEKPEQEGEPRGAPLNNRGTPP
jgi:hypothetical protein